MRGCCLGVGRFRDGWGEGDARFDAVRDAVECYGGVDCVVAVGASVVGGGVAGYEILVIVEGHKEGLVVGVEIV